MPHVLVWDIETVPDISGYAAANDLFEKTAAEVREAMGDKFLKHIYHSIICISLIAHHDGDHWMVDAVGAPHLGDRSEKELIASFVERIAELKPQLVTFNGSSFDLPVLRYRAMVHNVSAVGLSARAYFNRYTDDAIDLCDVLSSFAPRAKSTLHELCRVLGIPGKPHGIGGGDVEKYWHHADCRRIQRKRRADEARMLAGRTQDVWEREALLRVAEQWRVLAAHKASKESEANSLIEFNWRSFKTEIPRP